MNMGPSETSSFHVVGTISDQDWFEGDPDNQFRGMQTVLLGSSNSAIVEFMIPEAGSYIMVDHHFANASQGAVGLISTTAKPAEADLEHHNIPATPVPSDPGALQGKLDFESKCLACHSVGQGRKLADLAGVTKRRNDAWLSRWLKSPEKMLETDADAKAMLKEYNNLPMPNQSLSDAEVRQYLQVFRTNDGANSPNADVSTLAGAPTAYSLLLRKGLIRVGLAMPAGAEFELVAVDDPYHYASAAELSLFRRPLPTTNLKFLTTVMWDGRETFPPADDPLRPVAAVERRDAGPRTGRRADGRPARVDRRAGDHALFAQVSDTAPASSTPTARTGGPDAIVAQPFAHRHQRQLRLHRCHTGSRVVGDRRSAFGYRGAAACRHAWTGPAVTRLARAVSRGPGAVQHPHDQHLRRWRASTTTRRSARPRPSPAPARRATTRQLGQPLGGRAAQHRSDRARVAPYARTCRSTRSTTTPPACSRRPPIRAAR